MNKDDLEKLTGPDPEWLQSQDWITDSFAQAETDKFGQLEKLGYVKKQTEIWCYQVLSFAVPVTIFIAFCLFWVGILVYAFHLLTPWAFLDAPHLDKLHNILFSGAIGAVIGEGIRKYLK